MSRTAQAASPVTAEIEAASATLDELIARGRARGHVSLSELRTAFSEAGITPAEGRSLLRELSDRRSVRQREDTPVDPDDNERWKPFGDHVADHRPSACSQEPEEAARAGSRRYPGGRPRRPFTLGDSVHTHQTIGRRNCYRRAGGRPRQADQGGCSPSMLGRLEAPRPPVERQTQELEDRRGRLPRRAHAGGQPAPGGVGGHEVQRPRHVPARRRAEGTSG